MTITDLENSDTTPDDGEPQRRAWRSLFKRRDREPTHEEVFGDASVSAELVIPEEPTLPENDTVVAWVEKHAIKLPHPQHLKARIKKVAPHIPGVVVKMVVVKLPHLVWVEVVGPTWIGTGKCLTAYNHWVTAAHLDDAQKAAEGPLKAKNLANRHKSHGYRIWATLFAVGGAVGGALYLFYVHSAAFWVVIITVIGLLDVIGRAGTEKKKEFAPVYREPWHEGMSYKQLTETMQSAFNEIIGLDGNSNPLVRMDGVCTYDFRRQEWRQFISTYQEIDPDKHMRALERAVGWRPRSMMLLEVPESATRRIVVVKDSDPFANMPSAPWVPPQTKSITEGLELGKSQTDHPFVVHFAGVHVGIVAGSGGGKSEGVISAIIEGIMATYNAVIFGIDLTEGPLFPIYGDCIERVAYTPEDADTLLDFLLEKIKVRAKILGDIARSDDPTKKGREWNAELADEYNEPSIHLIVDEAPQAVKFNGMPKNSGVPDLAGKLEIVARTGSKHWITLVTGAQKTGKSDSGTTGLSSQIMTWLVGPCTQQDANEIFSPELRKAGWAPHLLRPAVRGKAANDAGRVYVSAAGFGPDVYCTWKPMPEEEIKRRRRLRLETGITRLEVDESNTVEGTAVPPILVALLSAVEDINPPDGRLPSKLAAEWISEHSNKEMTQSELADELKKALGDNNAPRTKTMKNKLSGNCNCYLVDDIRRAEAEL